MVVTGIDVSKALLTYPLRKVPYTTSKTATRPAGLQQQQVTEVVRMRFAAGQISQYSGQQEHRTPLGWHGIILTP